MDFFPLSHQLPSSPPKINKTLKRDSSFLSCQKLFWGKEAKKKKQKKQKPKLMKYTSHAV